MPASAKVIADSESPDGVRLITLECVFARAALAELNTHRMLSRNSASSRAIPVAKMIERVLEDPYIPAWTKNQKGMAGELLDPDSSEYKRATLRWLNLRDATIEATQAFDALGVHKQDANRALEPWMWHTAILSATEWDNFEHLRNHPAAYHPMQALAKAIIAAKDASKPKKLDYGEWHLPYWDHLVDNAYLQGLPCDENGSLNHLRVKASAMRCARVSYLTQNGVRDPNIDIKDCDVKLIVPGHMSPLEHPARPIQFDSTEDRLLCRMPHAVPWHAALSAPDLFCGNFRGWVQFRKTIPNEHDILNPRNKV